MFRVFELGNMGVELFFVISGFILALPFAEQRLSGGKPISLRSYFARRLSRLEPPYIINLTLLLGLMVAANGFGVLGDRLPHYLASIFYVHNVGYGTWSEINFVAWSLEVEAQFYILAPLLALVFSITMIRLRRASLIVAIIGCGILAGLVQDWPFRWAATVFFFLEYFLFGFLLADFRASGQLNPSKTPLRYDVLALIAFVSCFFVWPAPAMGAFVPKHMVAIPMGLFIYGVFRGKLWRQALSAPLIYVYGGMCYTVYLYHFWIMQAALMPVWKVGVPWNMATVSLAVIYVFAAVGVVSAVLFALFEKPFMYRQWPARVSGFASARFARWGTRGRAE